MVAVPELNPVTIPVVEPTEETEVLLVLQVPPVVASVNVVEDDVQILDEPAIAATLPTIIFIVA